MTPPRSSFSAPSLVLAFLLGVATAMLGGELTSSSLLPIYVTLCGDSSAEDEDQILRMGQKARVALGDMGEDITVQVANGTDEAVASTRDGNIAHVRPRTRPTEVSDKSEVPTEPIGGGNVVLVRAGPRLIQVIPIATANQIELCALHGEKQLGVLVRDVPDSDLLRVGNSPIYYQLDSLTGLFSRRRLPVLVLPVVGAHAKRSADRLDEVSI